MCCIICGANRDKVENINMEKQESSPTNTNVESTSNPNPAAQSAPSDGASVEPISHFNPHPPSSHTGANVEPISNLNSPPSSPPVYASVEPISYPNLAPSSYTFQQPQQFLPPTVPQFLPPTGQSMPAYPGAYYIVSPLPQQPNQQHQQLLQQVVLSTGWCKNGATNSLQIF